VLDTRTWAAAASPAPQPGHPDEPDAGPRVLQAAGWRVLRVQAGTSLAEVWSISGLALTTAGSRG
jgi:hypothetical protein